VLVVRQVKVKPRFLVQEVVAVSAAQGVSLLLVVVLVVMLLIAVVCVQVAQVVLVAVA